MRTFTIRERLASRGLILIIDNGGWLVTDDGVKHPFEKRFKCLEDVELFAKCKENQLKGN